MKSKRWIFYETSKDNEDKYIGNGYAHYEVLRMLIYLLIDGYF
jgi:hypothetical protein